MFFIPLMVRYHRLCHLGSPVIFLITRNTGSTEGLFCNPPLLLIYALAELRYAFISFTDSFVYNALKLPVSPSNENQCILYHNKKNNLH